MSSQIGYVANIYGFVSTFISPITTRLDMIVNHYPLILPGRDYDVTTTRSSD